MMTPNAPIISNELWVSHNASTTPERANGMVNIITNGFFSDSNWLAITIYTSMIISMPNIVMSPKVSCWSS